MGNSQGFKVKWQNSHEASISSWGMKGFRSKGANVLWHMIIWRKKLDETKTTSDAQETLRIQAG